MATEELQSPPSLAGLYAKAVAGLVPGGRPDALPERRLALRGLEVDVDRLADYSRVCGYTLGATLPPTYPHLLGFPLELELMSARSFPFPVMGVVHIANRIGLVSPIATDQRLDVLVWAEGLRPHRRGRQFEVVTEVEVGGEPVWREHSTYLRPGEGAAGEGDPEAGSGGSREPGESGDRQRGEPDQRGVEAGGEQAEQGAEREGEIAAVWSIPGDVGRRYGEVSGDRNPIHIHALTAKPFGFGGAIAHGMWMKARCLAALGPRLPRSFDAAVEFRRPLRIPGEARFRVGSRDGGFGFTLEPATAGRAHLRGSVTPRGD